MAVFDTLVVGGGIVGIATAWRAALRGQKTLLIERFSSMLHTRGSSHGRSRIIRRTYFQDHYTRAMGDAYALWNEAQAMGKQIMRVTGGLDIGEVGNPGLAAIARGCERFGVRYEKLCAAEVRARFPLIHPSDGHEAIFSPEAGVIDADGAREALLALALRAGCELRTSTAVADIAEDASGAIRVDLVSAAEPTGASATSVQAASVVIAAGPWAPALMRRCAATRSTPWAALPLAPKKVRAMLWAPTSPEARAQVSSAPVFIDYSPQSPTYGMPDPSGLLKIASHDGPLFEDADARDEQDDEASALAVARDFIARCVPAVNGPAGPASYQHCTYTMTPDEDFILDAMPVGSGRLVLGAACSGHGFKLAPWAGEALAGLAAGDGAGSGRSWDRSELGPFRADRDFGSFAAPCIMGARAGASATRQ